ncbi:MAG TPA: hypothetical protein VGJ71_07065 [Candidatus Limnocylindrales bacterium]|jgi:hypothetical protein
MHRRPLGSGRRLAGLAALVILVACFLPWWQTSGELGVQLGGNAFDGAGVVVFFDALAVIALLALPYAAGDVPVGLDRPLSFLILAAVGWVAGAIRLVDLAAANLEAVYPQRAYGLWLAALGLIILSRAAYNISNEPRR